MTKAHITTKDGTKITVEGTSDEVAAVVAKLEGGSTTPKKQKIKTRARRSVARTGPIGLISEYVDGGFFKKPKELKAIKLALEEQGHFYPATSLSPALLRLVRNRRLRRIKDKKRWVYVG